MSGGPRGHDGQGQRQAPAQLDDFLRSCWLRRDPVRAQPAFKRLPGREHGGKLQREQPGALGHGQAGPRVPARRDHQTSRAAGQERADLPRVARVFQHDEDVLCGQDASVQVGLGVEVAWYVPGWWPQRIEQSA